MKNNKENITTINIISIVNKIIKIIFNYIYTIEDLKCDKNNIKIIL